jgi:hypothetical protein
MPVHVLQVRWCVVHESPQTLLIKLILYKISISRYLVNNEFRDDDRRYADPKLPTSPTGIEQGGAEGPALVPITAFFENHERDP